jgi:hypothetical protein
MLQVKIGRKLGPEWFIDRRRRVFNLRRLRGLRSTLTDKVMTRPIGVTLSALMIGVLGIAQVAAVGGLLVLANKPAEGGWFPGLVTIFFRLLMLVLVRWRRGG